MRNLIFTIAFSILSIVAYSQATDTVNLSYDNPIVTIDNKTFELIEFDVLDQAKVKYTEVSITGITTTGFYLDSKVDGIWENRDSNGILLASIKYENGKKIWYRRYSQDEDVTIRYVDGKPFSIESKKLLANN